MTKPLWKRSQRTLVNVIDVGVGSVRFVIPDWDGGKRMFRRVLPVNIMNQVEEGFRLWVYTQICCEDPRKLTFKGWEIAKPMTQEEIDKCLNKD
jgi:hypothetical protein